jgi:hypothetical protein
MLFASYFVVAFANALDMASQIQGLSMFIKQPAATAFAYKKGGSVNLPPSCSRCHAPSLTVRRVHVMTILALATSTTPSAPVI